MQDTVLMRVVNGAPHLGDEFHSLSDRHRRAFNYFIKLSAFDELHAEVALAIPLTYLINGHDAWMIESRRSFRLQAKSPEVGFSGPLAKANDFQSNYTVEALLSCTKHDSLSAAPNFFQ